MATSRDQTLAELDPVLGPVAAAHRASPTRRAALALLTKGRSSDPQIPASRVVAWSRVVLRRTRADVVAMLTGPARYALIADATARVEAGRSQEGRRDLLTTTARRLTGSLLAPGGAGVRDAGARAYVAVAGLRIIDRLRAEVELPDDVDEQEQRALGATTTRLDAGRVGVELGVTRATASGWLRHAVDRKWINVVRSSEGHVPAVGLQQLRGQRVATADAQRDLTAAVMTGELDHPGAAALRSVAHPWWGYGPASRRTWLVLVADAVGLDAVDLGVPRRAVTAARALLDQHGIVAGPDLMDRLDELARTVDGPDQATALDRLAAARADQEQRAADRLAGVEAAREERAALRSGTIREVPLPAGYDHKSAAHREAVRKQLASRHGLELVRIKPVVGVALGRVPGTAPVQQQEPVQTAAAPAAAQWAKVPAGYDLSDPVHVERLVERLAAKGYRFIRAGEAGDRMLVQQVEAA